MLSLAEDPTGTYVSIVKRKGFHFFLFLYISLANTNEEVSDGKLQ